LASQEEYDIVGGVFDGQKLDKKGVIQITKLPTKQELMGQTAMLIKQLPTKLARSLNNAGAQRLADDRLVGREGCVVDVIQNASHAPLGMGVALVVRLEVIAMSPEAVGAGYGHRVLP
jgi:hypothetical protein